MVLGGGEEEPGCGEGLQEVEQLVSSHHGQTFQVRRNCGQKPTKKENQIRAAVAQISRQGVTFHQRILTVHYHSEKTVEERLEAMVAAAEDLMEDLNRPIKLQDIH